MLTTDARDASGRLLLRAGRKIEGEAQLRRLQQPDVRFGFVTLVSDTVEEKESEALCTELDLLIDNIAPDLPNAAERLRKAAKVKAQAVEDISEVFQRVSIEGAVDIITAQQAARGLVLKMMEDPTAITVLTVLKDSDAYTFTHSVNVSVLAMQLATHIGHQAILEEICLGGLLHDIGKVKTPLPVLHKPGKLSSPEAAIIREHPRTGCQLLKAAGIDNPVVLACVLQHHEKMTGAGYPNHEPADHVKLWARIICLADVYDALTTDRPYRDALSSEEALDIMSGDMHADFDEWLLQEFAKLTVMRPGGPRAGRSAAISGTDGSTLRVDCTC